MGDFIVKNADMKYLKVLATQYPNIAACATEIVNLNAILNLPKPTEHFITDVHGEYEQFRHIMSNASGAIERKIEDEFGSSLPVFIERLQSRFAGGGDRNLSRRKEGADAHQS